MTVTHRVGAVEGHPVLCKAAGPGPEAERLAHEAAMLRAAAHPGVVTLVDVRSPEGGGVEVVVALAGSRTLADVRTDLEGIAGLVAAVAATVADLHQQGVVHGRLGTEHVVVDRSGRPVLCGFGGAALVAHGGDPATDVAGLGSLLAAMIARCSPDPPPDRPLTDRVLARWRPADRRAATIRRNLHDLASRAAADAAAPVRSARAFAEAALAAVPAPPTSGRSSREHTVTSVPEAPGLPPGWRRVALGAPAILGLGLLAFGIGGLIRAPRAAGPGRADPVSATTASPTASSSTAPPSTGSSPTTSAPAPAVAPTGEPPVVEAGGHRYRVGRAGDVALVGDWDCDGTATVALLRPSTGDIFVFDSWAAAGRELSVPATTTVPSATQLALGDDRSGCPGLVALDAGGGRTPVVLR